MATIEELQAQIAALTARVDAITAPPETYYTMQYQGETIDAYLQKISTAVLEQEFPYVSGISNDNTYARSVYWVDPFGVVTFYFQAVKSGTSADIANGEQLAIFPEGVRPSGIANFSAHIEVSGSMQVALGIVSSNGSSSVLNATGASSIKVFGTGSFLISQ